MNKLSVFTALFLFLSASLFTIGCDKEECPAPSTKHTELVKNLLNQFGTGDIPGFLANCAADCKFDLTGNQILNPGKVYIGNDSFMAFLGDLSAKGQPTAINPLEFLESGNAVTVNGTIEFMDFGSSQTCTANFIQVWKFNTDGKLILLKEDHDNRVCN